MCVNDRSNFLSVSGFGDIPLMFCAKGDCDMLNTKGRPLMGDKTYFSEWGARFVAERGGRDRLRPFVN